MKTDDPRINETVLWAWIGEDELGSGEVGLKQGLVSAGFIPLVACDQMAMDRQPIIAQLRAQSYAYGKTIYLARFVFAGVEKRVTPDD